MYKIRCATSQVRQIFLINLNFLLYKRGGIMYINSMINKNDAGIPKIK